MDKSLILIIEDDLHVNDVLAEMARVCNYDVVQAYNGKEALELLAVKNIKPVVVLCDLKMPVMDGIDFIKESIVKNLDLNICLITANNEHSCIVEALQLGVADYISKPFKIGALTEKLKLMVDIGKRKNVITSELYENSVVKNSIKINNLLKVKNSQK